jgi:hypothetical protein
MCAAEGGGVFPIITRPYNSIKNLNKKNPFFAAKSIDNPTRM